MRFLKVDIKRALTEKTFLLAIGIGMIAMSSGLIYYICQNQQWEATEAFKFSQATVYAFIAPLVATIPYSNMNMIESDFGYRQLMLNKLNIKSYEIYRWFTNGIIGGIALVVPLVIFLLICRLFSPYQELKLILQVIGLDFLFGFSCASIAYLLTFFNSKRFLPIVIPQVFYLLFIYSFPHLGLEAFYPPLMFSPWILPITSSITHLMIPLLCLIVLSFLGIIGVKVYQYITIIQIRK